MHSAKPDTQITEWAWHALRFRFYCQDPRVTARVAQVMAPWQQPGESSAGQPESVTLNQYATLNADGSWTFVGSQPEAQGPCRSIVDITRAVETDATLAVLNATSSFVSIHGALLTRNGTTTLIIGPSMSGKSTLACQLWLDGWQLLGDDVTLLLSNHEQTPGGLALPRRVSLRSTSRPLLPTEKWDELAQLPTSDTTEEGILFHPAQADNDTQHRPLSSIIFLQRPGARAGNDSHLATPVHPADAVLAACTYTNIARKHGMGESLARISPLLSTVPAFDLARADLVQMSEAVAALHGQPRLLL